MHRASGQRASPPTGTVPERVADVSPLRFTAAISSFLVLETPIVFLTALFFALALKDPTMWIAVAVCLSVGCFIFLWLKSFKVEIVDDSLTYSSLFGGAKTFALPDIDHVRAEMGIARYADRFRPTTRLVVATRKGADARTVDINLRVFGRSDVKRLVEALSATRP